MNKKEEVSVPYFFPFLECGFNRVIGLSILDGEEKLPIFIT